MERRRSQILEGFRWLIVRIAESDAVRSFAAENAKRYGKIKTMNGKQSKKVWNPNKNCEIKYLCCTRHILIGDVCGKRNKYLHG